MLTWIILCGNILACLSYKLTIIHDNEKHARFVEFNKRGGSCSTEDKEKHECFGGAARRKTAADKIRSENDNVVYVCGGDQFQGSLWYSVFKWKPIAMVMNEIGYDAMAFGNHEFDDGLAGLVPFVKALNATVVSTNIDSSGTELDGLYKKTLVLNIGGQKIGILGEPPSREKPEGDYPEVYKETGSPCLVVQDYAFEKYLGFLQVEFDKNGVVKQYNGNPILLNDSIAENAKIVTALQPLVDNLTEFRYVSCRDKVYKSSLGSKQKIIFSYSARKALFFKLPDIVRYKLRFQTSC